MRSSSVRQETDMVKRQPWRLCCSECPLKSSHEPFSQTVSEGMIGCSFVMLHSVGSVRNTWNSSDANCFGRPYDEKMVDVCTGMTLATLDEHQWQQGSDDCRKGRRSQCESVATVDRARSGSERGYNNYTCQFRHTSGYPISFGP